MTNMRFCYTTTSAPGVLGGGAQPTSCLCLVAVIQGDVNLHHRHMLDLNSQPKGGLEQDVKGRGAEYVDVTFVFNEKHQKEILLLNKCKRDVFHLFLHVFISAHWIGRAN